MRFNELMTGVKQDIAVKIYGEDLDLLQTKANEAAGLIRGVTGSADVLVEQVVGLPQIVIDYDRQRLAEYGLSVAGLNQIVQTAFSGGIAGQIFEGERRFDLVIRLAKAARQDLSAVRNLYVPMPNGHRIPLSEVANIQFEDAPAQVSRDNTRRRIVIGVNVRNRDTQSFVEDIQATLQRELSLPAGYVVTFGGEFENLQRAQQRLSIVVPLVLALIFVILFLSLRSVSQTLLIYTAIPFAAVGGVFALSLRGMPFSISAGVGFIALFGVAVLNGLVLISRLNELKAEGETDLPTRISLATRSRLRPIALTAITDLLGFLPMAISTSSGAEVQRPLATVVIGGIVSASLLTLIVLPVLYAWLEGRRSRSKPAAALILLGICLAPALSHAQTDPRPLTVEQALSLAMDHNGTIQAETYRMESRRALEKTAFNLPSTNVGIQYGQYNGFEHDVAVSLSQRFDLPPVYQRRAKLLSAQTLAQGIQRDITANRLAAQVKAWWYELIHLQGQQALLLLQDTLYTQFSQAATLRYQVGETNRLEMITADTKRLEISNQLQQNETDQQAVHARLQAILGLEGDFQTEVSSPIMREVSLDQLLQDSLAHNPTLGYLRQQLRIAAHDKALTQAQMLPSLTLGYQNQSLQGTYTLNGTPETVGIGTRFQSLSLGIAMPLWRPDNQAQVQAKEWDRQAAAAAYAQEQINLQGELAALVQAYLKHQRTVAYYREALLPQAEAILKQVRLGLSSGEIDYLAYVQGTKQAIDLKAGYLRAVDGYNQAVITLEMLLGQP
jgi:cobalt-zinc-cadmium resistance protein CzcA